MKSRRVNVAAPENKDDLIAALRQQVSMLTEELQVMQEELQAAHDELARQQEVEGEFRSIGGGRAQARS